MSWWSEMLQGRLLRKAAPTWEPIYDPEYTRVRDALMDKLRNHHIRLVIVKHGPDQYSAYYERCMGSDRPLSAEPEWFEKAPGGRGE